MVAADDNLYFRVGAYSGPPAWRLVDSQVVSRKVNAAFAIKPCLHWGCVAVRLCGFRATVMKSVHIVADILSSN